MQMDGMAYSYIPEWGNETRTGSMPYRFFSLLPIPMLHRTDPKEQCSDEIPIPSNERSTGRTDARKRVKKKTDPFTHAISHISRFFSFSAFKILKPI